MEDDIHFAGWSGSNELSGLADLWAGREAGESVSGISVTWRFQRRDSSYNGQVYTARHLNDNMLQFFPKETKE